MGKSKEIPTDYRLNVAAIIVNGTGQMLACRRSDMKDTWQLPQGGIDKGESPEAALKRELFEEIGASNFKILGKLPHSIRYDWPERLYKRGYRGQEQYYFLVQLHENEELRFDATGHDPEFDVPEVDAAEWLSPKKFLQRVSGFKKDAYTKAIEYFQTQYPNWLKSS